MIKKTRSVLAFMKEAFDFPDVGTAVALAEGGGALIGALHGTAARFFPRLRPSSSFVRKAAVMFPGSTGYIAGSALAEHGLRGGMSAIGREAVDLARFPIKAAKVPFRLASFANKTKVGRLINESPEGKAVERLSGKILRKKAEDNLALTREAKFRMTKQRYKEDKLQFERGLRKADLMMRVFNTDPASDDASSVVTAMELMANADSQLPKPRKNTRLERLIKGTLWWLGR